MYIDTDRCAFKGGKISERISSPIVQRTIKEYLNSLYGKECECNGCKNNSRTDGNGKKQNR